MNQPLSPPPSPPRVRRRRRRAILSLRQFMALSIGGAIAVGVGGVWLWHHWRTSSNPVTTPTPTAFTLPEESTSLTTKLLPSIAVTPQADTAAIAVQTIWKYRYNDTQLPEWQTSKALQKLVEDLKTLATKDKLPVNEMSVVLIDLNTEAIATHQAEKPHYPASIAKLFWMVALFGQFQQGLLKEADFTEDLSLMVQKSDNNATSHIVDQITRTQFQVKGTPEQYAAWRSQREQLNLFFNLAGYQNLNITQKTYPIADLQVTEPTGFDQQMRYDPANPKQPMRNQLSAWDAARLMYEIVTQQAIAPAASQKMLALLRHDLTQDWEQLTDVFNPVQDFFGADLPPETQLFSKAGWTSQCRHEVAYIASPDGKKRYILSIFADHVSYAENRTFFPAAAQYIYQNL